MGEDNASVGIGGEQLGQKAEVGGRFQQEPGRTPPLLAITVLQRLKEALVEAIDRLVRLG